MKLRRVEAVALAQTHQALPHSPTERELDGKRVDELVSRLRKGLLLPCCWATVSFAGTTYRMNGQHSSHALLAASDEIPEQVVIHLDHFETDTPEGMGALFRQFDARFSARSKQDVAGAYQGLVPALAEVSRRTAKLGIDGIGWYRRSIEQLPVPSDDELYQHMLLETYHSFLRWLDHILSNKTRELERVPVIAAMYRTFIASESGAQEFWLEVAKGNLTDDCDPRSVLSADLIRLRERKSGGKSPAPAEYFAKCIKAWNAFRAGDKIRALTVNPKKGLPDVAA
jgi:hypothetical protein